MTEVPAPGSLPTFTDPIAPLRIALRGRYEIERQIGQGAFATVYLARDLKHERKVAIKVLNADPTSETGEIRFIREIRLVARLQHPNILPLHDSGHVEALLYYVMPFVDGETLRLRMHRERQMGVDAACAIARETADALAYAHKQGIVHRDIKPENILLSGGHAIVADFGIARAIDVAGVKQLTATGVAGPGTPAYMSPEQLLGDRAVDTRSDIYSLGCVLYEMIVGKPPFPGKDGFVKRFTEPPPHISSLRRDAPPWLDAVIAKALSKDPADRYATGADFVAALSQPVAPVRTHGRPTPMKNALASPPLFDSDPLEAQEIKAAFPDSFPSGNKKARERLLTGSAWHPRHWRTAVRSHPLAAGIVGLAVAGLIAVGAASGRGFPSMFAATPPVDSTRFVVLASAGSAGGIADAGSQIADSLYDAFTKWEGLPIVPNTRVEQAIVDGAAPPRTEAAAIRLARLLGAGKTVWVQTGGSAARPRIHLYDSRSGESLHEFSVPAVNRDEQFYTSSAQRLLGVRNRPPAGEGCDGGTRSFPAWFACGAGHVALAEWDLTAAERSFRAAVSADAAYGTARLWLAQILAWRAPEARSEAYDLVRGSTDASRLTVRDGLAAQALTAFFEQRFPAACASYRELTKIDSLDFLGWYGLGECQVYDSAVVRSSSSPSRWAFRASSHSAMTSYMTALRVEPAAHEIFSASKLQMMMPVSSTQLRIGISVGADRTLFAAMPTLELGDTIGFVPYPGTMFASVPRTAAMEAAWRKNTRLLSDFTALWAARFPRSPRAQEALADAFEARADLGDGSPRASPAMRAVDSAISLTLKSGGDEAVRAEITRLRARKVRFYFKRGEFSAARVLADSILAAPAAGSEKELDWIAALVGRADLAALYWQRSLGTLLFTGGVLPPMVARSASRYYAYAAMGICGPSLSLSREQLESALRVHVAGDIRETVRSDLADRSDRLATPCTGGRSAVGTRVTTERLRLAQQAFGRGEFDRARDLLAAAANARRGQRPGDLSADHRFQDAWLRVQLGDTAAAEASLDAALGALPTFGSSTFKDLPGAAAFGRIMDLRAQLAAKRGDVPTARKWTSALNDLWASADAPLRRAVADIARPGG